MQITQTIATDTIYVGGSDRRLAKFENLFPIPRGVSYNSYVILDEKTALMDTTDASITAHFIENITAALAGRSLDYLVIDHMEPDHAATLAEVLLRWPTARIVCNAKTVPMLKMYFPGEAEYIAAALLVKEGDTLALGKHTLHFIMAPMVHWPEVMMAFDDATGVLYTADAFGTFGAIAGTLFADEVDYPRDWLDDARRYYVNIVGKYGVPVQTVLKKAAALPIQTIAPLHGPIWRKDLGWIIDKYNKWSLCEPEDKAVVLLYGSMYGNTENAVNALASALARKGVTKLAAYDLSVTDNSVCMAECFRASHIVLACPTYNGGLYLPMAALIDDMKALALHDRTFALIESGSWAPAAAKQMADKLAELKNAAVLAPRLTIRGSLTDAQAADIDAMADAIIASMQ